MQLGINFYICEALLLIFGLAFAVRICSLKRDAWYFYFLATISGSFQFVDFSQFDLASYLSSLPMYSHDLILPLIAILIHKNVGIYPRKINKDNILFVITFSTIISILMIGFNYLTLPVSPFTNWIFLTSVIFGILVYVGSALLAFGYIAGLLINAIYSLQFVIVNAYFMAVNNQFAYYMIFVFIFNFISFIVFLYGYNKNSKNIIQSKEL